MASFAKTAEMISRCMGYPENSFIDAFDKNIKLQAKEAIASNTVATAITKFTEHLYSIGSRNASILAEKLHDGANCSLFWIGTPTKLLQVLKMVAEEYGIDVHGKSWPKASNSLSRQIAYVKTSLRLSLLS
jgi:hypothetical protein